MKRFLPLTAILVLAAFLRLYHLPTNPPSLYWDEVSLGYNAYSLLHTAKDEYGNFLPISIRSFNDYKPPLYAYLTIPFVALFGLDPLAVRLPSALSGITAVFLIYLLTSTITNSSPSLKHVPLLTALLLAISPWHLQFSRAAFEANLALTLLLAFLLCFNNFLDLKPSSSAKTKTTWLLLAALFAALSLFAYHSARVVTPIFVLYLGIFYHRKLFHHKRLLLAPLILGLLTLIPLYTSLRQGSLQSRFSTVSVFSNPSLFSFDADRTNRALELTQSDPFPINLFHHPRTVQAIIIAKNYFEHFNFDFIFLYADQNPRHHASSMGLLYLFEAVTLVLGAYSLSTTRLKLRHLIIALILIGPLPASLTTSTPHAIRSYLMLPGLIILSAFGLNRLLFSRFSGLARLIPIVTVLIIATNFLFYATVYSAITPTITSKDWQYAYPELVSKIQTLRSQYQEVIISNTYDQPHIYFAFYTPIPPKEYHQLATTASETLYNLSFKQVDHAFYRLPNRLIVVEPDNTPEWVTPFDTIKFLDGSIAFNLIETPNEAN